ncbi:glycoside hydrolase family 15 protein [Micrococcus sp. HG099]|uniref:glycoside hydrolase family 15 protein n=1 Tax=Micrococcus sp. HG099 TaxID=2969755 RepID=UPI00215ACD30|nr:glycoside hydrolase family 15 protein [Micrococcus sp. HG099]MCR8675644.1 glycoside hydrolase family 15 protein [Micrococcus sp. HG099]
MTTATPRQPLIEDHAYLSNQHSGALLTRDGDVTWLCLPRFDAPSVFTSLLGEPEHGRWRLRIADGEVRERAYLPGTLVLRTRWCGPDGEAEVLDFMPLTSHRGSGRAHDDDAGALADEGEGEAARADLVRLVRCTSGSVSVDQCLQFRMDYGEVVPWVSRQTDPADESFLAVVAGGDALAVHGPDLRPDGTAHRGRTRLEAGQSAAWTLAWYPSWSMAPAAPDPERALEATVTDWVEWLGEPLATGPRADRVARSLLVLKGLTHRDTGGIVAAPTASLPEDIGGVRNWDYRYVWLRDTALTLEALMAHNHTDDACAWRDWLLRAIAGDPRDVQIMYTLSGERRMPERDLEHLPGYEGSRPVHVGNGAADQWQADVIGTVMLALGRLRDAGVDEDRWSWTLQKRLVERVLEHRDTKEHGLWEMRGEPAYFTHGRVMMWAALDQALHAARDHGLPAEDEELAAWEQARDELREEILTEGVGPSGGFRQTYASEETDASLLQIPHTGFLPHDDPRMLATVADVERDLVTETGLVMRYRASGMDGLPGEEAPFMMCGFWLVEQYARSGRLADAERLMARLDECSNDLFLMAEEYDDGRDRMAGNFPQAFSHLGLIRAVDALEEARGAAGGEG